jgi:hypothetical protein
MCHGGLLLNQACRVELGSWRRVCRQCSLQDVQIPLGRCRLLTDSKVAQFSTGRTYYIQMTLGELIVAQRVRPFTLTSTSSVLLIFASEAEAQACESAAPPGLLVDAQPEHQWLRMCCTSKSLCPHLNFTHLQPGSPSLQSSCAIHARGTASCGGAFGGPRSATATTSRVPAATPILEDTYPRGVLAILGAEYSSWPADAAEPLHPVLSAAEPLPLRSRSPVHASSSSASVRSSSMSPDQSDSERQDGVSSMATKKRRHGADRGRASDSPVEQRPVPLLAGANAEERGASTHEELSGFDEILRWLEPEASTGTGCAGAGRGHAAEAGPLGRHSQPSGSRQPPAADSAATVASDRPAGTQPLVVAPPRRAAAFPLSSVDAQLRRADVHGTLFAHGETLKASGSSAWTVVSDARLKEVSGAFPLGAEELMKLKPKVFRYNGLGGTSCDGRTHVGLIAQELPAALEPYCSLRAMVQLYPDDPYPTEIQMLDHSAVPFLCVNAIREHEHRIRRLEDMLGIAPGAEAAPEPSDPSVALATMSAEPAGARRTPPIGPASRRRLAAPLVSLLNILIVIVLPCLAAFAANLLSDRLLLSRPLNPGFSLGGAVMGVDRGVLKGGGGGWAFTARGRGLA